MSKFIQQENQRLLWNVSQKLPNIRDIFPNVTEQGNWFKDVIQHFYEKRKREHLSKVELENLNKQTIQYMIDFMKHKKIARQDDGIKRVTFGVEPLDHQVNTPFAEFMGHNNNILITPRPQAIIGEPRIVSTNVLEERQREYENMLKREVPAEPNFHELEKDTVIENMEELMQQQLRERELLYLPNPNVLPTEPKTDQLSGPNLTPKVAKLPLEFEKEKSSVPDTCNKNNVGKHNKSVPGWKKSDYFLKSHPNIHIETGADKTGNILSMDNFLHCRAKYGSSMDLITGDGGFDFSADFNNQEMNITQLLFAQMCYALCLQKYNGSFILKIFDCFMEHTVDILYILSAFYETVYITKPKTSRYANSEKYLVCKNFLLFDDS